MGLGPLRHLLFFLLLLASAAMCSAHIAAYDDFWKIRADAARNKTLDAYAPQPEDVVNHFNAGAIKSWPNSTRRSLNHRDDMEKGPCVATNPIDRCWRCQEDWALHRQRLAHCAKGFGRHTRGGFKGAFYVVTDASDDELVNLKPGTLRYGVTRDVPLWITFARDMVIRLQQELIINSNKTIDGRGANVHIAYGAGLTIQFVEHVIIHNLHIHDIIPMEGGNIRDSETHWGLRTRSDGDGISIFGSTNIWIDHISLYNCADGLIDAIMGSTAITISNCHLTRHNDVILLGASEKHKEDTKMQVTVAYNHFGKGLVQRMPRCRWGFFHVVNNDYTHWLMYAVGGSQQPTIISQGNRFLGPPMAEAKEVTHRESATEEEWRKWNWRSEGDLFLNGAFFVESGHKIQNKHSRLDFIKAKDGSWAGRLARYSGCLTCKEGKRC